MIPRDPLTLQRQLAGLATLEATVRTTLRGLYTTYLALARRQSDDDVPELTSARMLADACNDLLIELYDHRLNVAQRLRALQHPEQTAWPF